MNPRSVYNKINEFHEFVKNESIDIVFMSESWERENKTLKEIINLENYEIVSNVHQRKGQGGRPALIINKNSFNVINVTNSLISVKWGVEAVWAILTPKNVCQSSKVKKIACCALYSKPGSKHKTDLLDHLSDAFNILNTKFGKGLHFIIAGDTNELRLKPIIDLSPSLVQIVNKPTRIDILTGKKAMLDPVIMTLTQYYQEPEILAPLDPDPDKDGKPADHNIVVCRPISTINNFSARVTRKVEVQPITDSGISKMKDWLIEEDWKNVTKAKTSNEKAETFQNILRNRFKLCFPKKQIKVSNDDQPWFSQKIQKLDRQRKRIYHKHGRSAIYKKMDKQFKKEVKVAKSNFYKKMVSDLKDKDTGQWYKAVKRMTSYESKPEQIIVDNINHLSDREQCELIADEFAEVPNQYNPLNKEDIQVPVFYKCDIPQFTPAQVWKQLSTMKTNKSCIDGDVPAKVFKVFAAYLAEPLSDIINCSISTGEYPDIWKEEIATPIPKTQPILEVTDLRNISGLLNCDRIAEKLIAQLMLSDMEAKLDPSQYGNTKGKSINHYLILMIHRILTALDNNSKREIFAVVANLIDWSKAFPRQCPELGVKSFIQNGVRPSLIPVLVNYFQKRKMTVKWHGHKSTQRDMPGGGPAGATLGLLEYLSQSNDSANCVKPEDRFKFVDDLTVLEIINLLTIGMSSVNVKFGVPNDIPSHNQFISPENLQSQQYLNAISDWTTQHKMKINQKKTKAMIFNFTNNHQFTTRLSLNGENVEIVSETKLLGTIIENDLTWNANTSNLVKRANARMVLLRKLSEFGAPTNDLRTIYITYIRSVLEQSAVVWHTSLTQQNIQDLERVQKTACKIILRNKCQDYMKSLQSLNLETLHERRVMLCLKCLHLKVQGMQVFLLN